LTKRIDPCDHATFETIDTFLEAHFTEFGSSRNFCVQAYTLSAPFFSRGAATILAKELGKNRREFEIFGFTAIKHRGQKVRPGIQRR
jgi:hypothetical protein